MTFVELSTSDRDAHGMVGRTEVIGSNKQVEVLMWVVGLLEALRCHFGSY
jgi:hypothetical protein